MDASTLQNLSKGQKVAAGAGLAALIATFLPWYTIKVDFFGSSSLRGTSFNLGWLGMLLLVGAAALTVAPAFGKEVGNDQIKGEQIALGLAGLGTLFWLIRFVSVPGGFLNNVGRGFGLFVALAAAAGVVAGVVMTMKEKGIEMPNADNFKSLKDGVSTTTATEVPAPPHSVQPPAPAHHTPPAPAPQPVQHTPPAPAPQPVQHTPPAPPTRAPPASATHPTSAGTPARATHPTSARTSEPHGVLATNESKAMARFRRRGNQPLTGCRVTVAF